MGLKPIDRIQASAVSVRELGLDCESTGLDSPEALAAALRRAASFLCPITARRLVATVAHSLQWLVEEPEPLADVLAETLEALIGYGDLLELTDVAGWASDRTALFLGPPSYIERQSGSCLLVGIKPEGQPLVGYEVEHLVQYERHIRSLEPAAGQSFPETLHEYGLRAVAIDQWLRSPRLTPARELIQRADARLDAVGDTGAIEDLTILDSAKSVTYYRGRWRRPTGRDEGRFVARRPRGYGADLWCYVELKSGVAVRALDLPIGDPALRGCDEAWQLQAAIDFLGGRPQLARVRPAGNGRSMIQLFSPPPSWLQRRWDTLGTPVINSRALISYCFDPMEVREELRFLEESLWMATEDRDG